MAISGSGSGQAGKAGDGLVSIDGMPGREARSMCQTAERQRHHQRRSGGRMCGFTPHYYADVGPSQR